MTVKVGLAVGRCPRCGRVHVAHRPATSIICDCYRICPICGSLMTPYKPDLTLQTYGRDGKRDLKFLFVCMNHSPPYYSSQKPVEVVLK